MIDQGFLPEIRKLMIKEGMPPKGKKQMLMFSATFPVEVQRLASEFLADNYLFLAVGVVGAANSDVEQRLLQVEKFQKRKKLDEVLGGCGIKERTLIFVEQKTTADFLAAYLSQNNYRATSIHGDRYQSQREEALRDFRTGNMPVLVATSVASRGLDIKDVRHVINYDLPKEIDDYVHRIGRTGRVGNLGMATSFYDSAQDKVNLFRDNVQLCSWSLIMFFCSSGTGSVLGQDPNGCWTRGSRLADRGSSWRSFHGRGIRWKWIRFY